SIPRDCRIPIYQSFRAKSDLKKLINVFGFLLKILPKNLWQDFYFTKRYLGVALSFNADYDIAGDILLKLSMSLLVAGRSYWNW
ncbi:hypothetical protein, partial [Streptococcus equi]|uniref:hypothetical protein n=2 Tax=Streptococcus equi TaxID=1336 RepID=UPI001E47DD0B